MKNFVGFLFAMIFSGLILAGCSSKAPEPATFTIEMTEYAFTPDKIEVKVGQPVTLNLINKGQLPHEIMFGRDVMMMDGHPNGYQQDMFMEAGVEPVVSGMMADEGHDEEESHDGFMVLLDKTGDQATMTFTVNEKMLGEWEMGCFELDGVHYSSGMKGTFVVTR